VKNLTGHTNASWVHLLHGTSRDPCFILLRLKNVLRARLFREYDK